MNERSRVLTATCSGAVVGGILGWLYLTGSGRAVRDQIEPRLDRYLDVIARAQMTGENVKTAITEGHRLLTRIIAMRESASLNREQETST